MAASVGRPKPGQDLSQLCQTGRFFKNCNGAKLLGLRGGPTDRVAAKDDDREKRMTAADLSQHGEATETRHDEVHEDAVHRCGREDIQSLGAVEGHEDLVPRRSDGFGQDLGHHRLVFHHQDSHDRHGMTILTGPRRSRKKVSRAS